MAASKRETMSKRYKKDHRIDGWPVIDTERQSVLSTDEIVNILNDQDQQINEMNKLLSDMANNAVFQRLHEIASKQT